MKHIRSFTAYIMEARRFTEADVVASAKVADIDISDYDMNEMIIGMNVESEHGSKMGDDVNVTGDQPVPTLKIVLAHMREKPYYYTKMLVPAEKKNESYIAEFRPIMQPKYDKYIDDLVRKSPVKIGAGVLIICQKTGRILLGMRSKYSDNPNMWCNFGGGVDPELGECEADVIKTARREMHEESGYTGRVDLIPSFVYETPAKTFKFYNFIGLVGEEFEPKLSWETSDARWFSLDELKKIDRKDFHFGLKLQFENDIETIKKYAR